MCNGILSSYIQIIESKSKQHLVIVIGFAQVHHKGNVPTLEPWGDAGAQNSTVRTLLDGLGRASPLLNQELDPVGFHLQMLFQSYNNPCRYQNHSLIYNDIQYVFACCICLQAEKHLSDHVDRLVVRLHTFSLAMSQDVCFGYTALKYLKVVV